MRYYNIRVTDPETGAVYVPAWVNSYNPYPALAYTLQRPEAGLWTYSSLNKGASASQPFSTNPGALRVELDIPTTTLADALPGGTIIVYGVGQLEVAQGADLNFKNIEIYGGMAKGLPLANFAQAGLLASGQISQCYGNRVGTETTLNIVVTAKASSPNANQTTANPVGLNTLPRPIADSPIGAGMTFQWSPGQRLLDALVQCISNAFPKYTIQGAISDNIVLSSEVAMTALYADLTQLAEQMQKRSLSIMGGYAPDLSLYQGIRMYLHDSTITITDGTIKPPLKLIQFQDMVGQPSWVGPFEIMAITVMRGDIQVGDYVSLPNGLATVSAGAMSQFANVDNQIPNAANFSSANSKSAFVGDFFVSRVRHVGDSRDGGGQSWVTTFSLIPAKYTPTPVDTFPVLYQGTNGSRYSFNLP